MKKQKKLWGGRFNQKTHPLFEKFNSSIHIDYILAKYDILGSIAWSESLLECNVLTDEEQHQIQNALHQILQQVCDNPKIMVNSHVEDIHTWIEVQLIKRIGNLGKKLHTGRSRNDQVTTSLKLWCKYIVHDLITYLQKIQYTLILQAEISLKCIMPGYTHLQRAQPITFAFWCLAYVEMFNRDESRLNNLLYRLNVSPLGSGALSGTFCKINREKLALRLGFASSTRNSLDAVSDRDYVVELLSIASMSMMHLSRFSEDFIFFNSGEVNFIELSDFLTSGSSLMPQKKNPDALELIRGKTGSVYGSLISMLVILKGLPLSYNKDLQEDKSILFPAINNWIICLKVAILTIKTVKININACLKSACQGYSNATELTEYLVHKGVTFREAHYIVGKIVLEAIQKKCALEDLNISDFQRYHILFDCDVYEKLNVLNCINSKSSKGGVSFRQMLHHIMQIKKSLHANNI
ncbi:argininosuccinate lyase [Buchnera aphidicola]|uniref:Argininosuccinate lyase n=1 Tax=Buchnera aphidicola (Sarucallis kahawaluokalani) TaxID=1241878 RepID=A0A4D6YJG1_9GAMM|nr:argininosuccinate lyase [Buchnera aphidicola]QCI25848.1 argininosuccinate lyase [Buchnera aphidicola (Sarucallis kahawaluokalani)]